MIASVLAFVGCQNEELVNDNSTDNGGKKVVLTANIQGAADSRVALTPDTDENGNPIVKVAWRAFDSTNPETFAVYDYNENNSTTFTQQSGNVFEGTLPESSNGYCAYYNQDLWMRICDTGEFPQDGTLREEDVMMYAEFDEGDTSIEFMHLTAILKPTFTLGGQSINSTITSIEMGEFYIGEIDIDITVDRTSQQTPLAENIYMTIPFYLWGGSSNFYPNNTFTFAVKADGKDYTGSLTISQFGEWNPYGKLFTANIALTEVEKVCNLPNEDDGFNDALIGFLADNVTLTSIKFIANSETTSDNQIGTCGAYMVANGTTLEIHTSASKYVFPEDCSYMFLGNGLADDDTQPLARITSIDFNDCTDTSNVTSMNSMFRDLSALTSLDLKCFDTSNVTNMSMMFAYCSKLESLDLTTFNVGKVTNFSDMLCMMSDLGNGNKTKVYVSDPNPFADKNTGINTYLQGQPANPEYAEYVVIALPEAVDLGLSVKWATYNVGANSPEEYGDYFAWGETQPKPGNTSCVTNNKTFDDLMASCIVDTDGNLTATYDAATANWGGDWHMPTDAEMQELLTQCNWTWTTQNGVNGYKVTSKTNSNFIFLPAAGKYDWRYGLSSQGAYGNYWSSTMISNSNSHSCFLDFGSSYKNDNSNYRKNCHTVRPVKK